MKAMVLNQICDLRSNLRPLELVDLPIPEPAENEILIKVAACGVCHTELDEIEGRTRALREAARAVHAERFTGLHRVAE